MWISRSELNRYKNDRLYEQTRAMKAEMKLKDIQNSTEKVYEVHMLDASITRIKACRFSFPSTNSGFGGYVVTDSYTFYDVTGAVVGSIPRSYVKCVLVGE